MSVVEFKIKNHKKYNKKILFIFFKENTVLDNSEELDTIITDYFDIILKNKNLSVILDTTNLKSIPLKLVLQKVNRFKGNEALLEKNVKVFSVIIKNYFIKTIFNVVAELNIFKSPHIMTDNDKIALNFVVEHLKNLDK